MIINVKALEEGAKLESREKQLADGISEIRIDIKYDSPRIPQKAVVAFDVPCTEIFSIYSPSYRYDRNNGPTWRRKVTQSRLASGAPIHQFISSDAYNSLTVALSDAMTPCEIASGLTEKTDLINVEIRLFTAQINTISEYSVRIYLDSRRILYSDALKQAEKYWEDSCGYPAAHIPAASLDSVYSTWYSFHQKFTDKQILKQCRLAKPLGMDTVIVDDGWQCGDNSLGYAYCGDWQPHKSKVRDMKAFVDAVHDIGMKFVLWYSVPALGVNSKAYAEYKDMTLNPSAKNWASLDPRFPKVRRHICEIYEKAAKDWGLDGFKLDFIDSFKIYDETPAFDERWDTTSLEEGVDLLLSEITKSLRAINPDMLIEFRQSYFGPVIKKYGNMIRVGDCPHDSLRNHVAGIDLKFLLGRVPVHSDMLMWNNDESAESAACQVITTLPLVPQISVLLDKIPKRHKAMLKFYLNFRNEHRDVLMCEDFEADNPDGLYSQFRVRKNGELIAICRTKNVVKVFDTDKSVFFINNGSDDSLIIEAKENLGSREYRILDCTGKLISHRTRKFTPGAYFFSVPRSGMIEIIKK